MSTPSTARESSLFLKSFFFIFFVSLSRSKLFFFFLPFSFLLPSSSFFHFSPFYNPLLLSPLPKTGASSTVRGSRRSTADEIREEK